MRALARLLTGGGSQELESSHKSDSLGSKTSDDKTASFSSGDEGSKAVKDHQHQDHEPGAKVCCLRLQQIEIFSNLARSTGSQDLP